MNEEEKKAIRQLEGCRDFWREQLEKPIISEEDAKMANKEIEHDTILLNLIDKQNKVIDEMAYCIYNYQICDYEIQDNRDRKCEWIADDEDRPCEDCIKQYFMRKVEEDE